MTEFEQLLDIAGDARFRHEGWDSYGAAPLDDRAVDAVRAFLSWRWAVVPINSGGLQLERHDSGCDLEIEFGADGRLLSIWSQVHS